MLKEGVETVMQDKAGDDTSSPDGGSHILPTNRLSSRQSVLAARARELCAEALEANDERDFHFGFCVVVENTPEMRKRLRKAPLFLSHFYDELCDLLHAKNCTAAANVYKVVLSALSSVFFNSAVKYCIDAVMTELERKGLVLSESRLLVFTRHLLTPNGEALCRYAAVQGRRLFNSNYSSDVVESETDFAEYDSPDARRHVFYISTLLTDLPHSVARNALNVKDEKISQCAARKKVFMSTIKGLLQSPPTRLQPEDQEVRDVILSTELLWSYHRAVILASSQ